MANITQHIEFNVEKDTFEHPLHIKIALTTITIFIIISTFLIHRQLVKFLRRPNRRCIDLIVDIHYTIVQPIFVIYMVFFNVVIWTKTPKGPSMNNFSSK